MKTKQICLRVTEEEYTKIQQKTNQANASSVTDFVLNSVLKSTKIKQTLAISNTEKLLNDVQEKQTELREIVKGYIQILTANQPKENQIFTSITKIKDKLFIIELMLKDINDDIKRYINLKKK